MKTNNVKVLLSAAILLLMAWAFAACSKKDDNPIVVADKTALAAAIASATDLLANATEGVQAGEYTVGAKAALQTALTAATTVNATATVTQAQVDAATTLLNGAIATFNSALIAPIGASDLIASWKMDEGTGTSIADASGNNHTGTLKAATASMGDGGVPTWVTDRFGVAAKALHFEYGGHAEVPKDAAFVPQAITISVWVNLDSTLSQNPDNGINESNYIVSQNDWHGWKFQTQSAKKPFFTVATTVSIFDKDTNNGHETAPIVKPSLILKQWYQIAVTYTDGLEKFYINGQLARTWTSADSDNPISGTIKPLGADQVDLAIGANWPNSYYETEGQANTDPSNKKPEFFGSMDDLKIYKVALTDAQIASLYAQEKP